MRNAVQETLDRLTNEFSKCNCFVKIEPLPGNIEKYVITLADDSDEFKRFLKTLPKNVVWNIQSTKDGVDFSTDLDGYEKVTLDVHSLFKFKDETDSFEEQFKEFGKEKSTLINVLVKSVFLWDSFDRVKKRLGCSGIPKLEENQKYEFRVDDNKTLCLYIVEECTGEEYGVWEGSNWEDIVKLLDKFDLGKDFDHLLTDITNLGAAVSNQVKNGLKASGMFDEARESKICDVLCGKNYSDPKKVNIYVGDFRPPCKKDFNFIKKTAQSVDHSIIFIDKTELPGSVVSFEQSKEIWEIYKKYLNGVFEIRESENPSSDITNLLNNPDLSDVTFKVFTGKRIEIDRVNQSDFPSQKNSFSKQLSSLKISSIISRLKLDTWIPVELSREDSNAVIDVIVKPLEIRQLTENIVSQITKTVRQSKELQEASSGTPISSTVSINSENKAKLSTLYDSLVREYGNDFSIQFNNVGILITPDYPTEMTGNKYDSERIYEDKKPEEQHIDYVPYMTSYLKFLKKEGKNIEPLPEIVLNKEKQPEDLFQTKTGQYDPVTRTVTLYSANRNPKDLLRSFAHEMEHHIQCLENKLSNISTEQISEDQHLEELEAEAYRDGNISFRKWTESERLKKHE